MKILYTHRTQGRAAEGAHVAGMVEAFRELGHEVTVDCLAGCDPTRPAPVASGDGVVPPKVGAVHRLMTSVSKHAPQWLFGVLEILYNLPLAVRLIPQLVRDRPDLVYERYALCTFVPALACKWMGIPHVLEVNDSVVIERSRPLKLARVSRFIEQRVVNWTRVVITISQVFRKQMLEGLNVEADKILVYPNAVSRRRFIDRKPLTPEDRQQRKQALGLMSQRVIGSAGQFLAWHGLPRFLAAAAPTIERLDLSVLFIGDGPVREETLLAAKQHGIADRVRFTGMVHHTTVPDYLNLLDVAVIPFNNLHCSPMKLMEFMAMGLPVLAPALPSVLAVMESGKTGFVFPCEDMPAMLSDMTRCLEHPALMEEVGRSAQAFAANYLTWDVHARAILEHMNLARS